MTLENQKGTEKRTGQNGEPEKTFELRQMNGLTRQTDERINKADR